jgi:hypothetical protein
MRKRRWSELTEKQQQAIVIFGAVELGLTVYALVDLRGRSDEQIRGSKRWWIPFVFVQPVGPVAYLLFGRQPQGSS